MLNSNTLVIAAAVFFALAAWLGFTRTTAPAADDRQAGLGNWEQVPMPIDYSDSTERFVYELGELNLFGKPMVAPATTDQPMDMGAEAAPEFRLLGIASLDGRKVILLDEGHGLPQKLGQGQSTMQGWTVTAIYESGVDLAKGDQAVELRMFPQGPAE